MSISELLSTRGGDEPSNGDGCDEEAVRLLKTSPKWKPGMTDEKAVRAAYTLPFEFKLPVEK